MDMLPYFARGSYAHLKKALSDGVFEDLDRTIYFFVTTGKYAGDFCIVDKDKVIHHVSSSALASQVTSIGEDVNSIIENITNMSIEINNLKNHPADTTIIGWEEM